MREFTMVIERDEDGWYVATVPEIPGCHTQAKSLDSLRKRVVEAIQACLEAQGSSAQGVEFVGVQRVKVPA